MTQTLSKLQSPPPNPILLCVHGSTLYGTSTPQSDADYKGIYKASLQDIVLGRVQDTIDCGSKGRSDKSRNNSNDVDCAYKELRKFINDALDGQIYALDLLFAPKQFWLEYGEIWEDIIANRSSLLSSNIKPFVGYARQQAAKYGLKGGRLAEVIRFRDWLVEFEPSVKIGEVFDKYVVSEYVHLNEVFLKKQNSSVTYIQVLEKQFQQNHKVGNLAQNLSEWIDKYGGRSREALSNNGVDFKAVSHAIRCLWQAEELLVSGHIELPLINGPYLREVKQGKHAYAELQEILSEGLERLDSIKSILPEKPDRVFWEAKILSYYL